MGRKFAFFLLLFISTIINASELPPSPKYEYLRRRIERNINNIWSFSKTHWNTLDKPSLKLLAEHKNSLLNDMDLLRINDGHDQWRERELQELSDLVQKRLLHLQNPKNCSTTRKVKCQLNMFCGFGSRIHLVVKCLQFAYVTERTLILDPKYRVYGRLENGHLWQDIFLPLSNTCLSSDGATSGKWSGNISDSVQVLEVPQIHPKDLIPGYSMVIPSDIAPRLKLAHGDPFVWWTAQLIKFIWRYQPETQRMVERRADVVDFSRPIVGVQIRRTDKLIKEAKLHVLDEYMEIVDDYFDRLEMSVKLKKRRIFMATDEPEVINEVRLRYPQYETLADKQVATLGSGTTDFRGIVTDVDMLSRCDYLVCTMTSNICRLAYELRLARDPRPSAAGKYTSLDSIYFLYGHSPRKHKATLVHKGNGEAELDVLPGDVILDRDDQDQQFLNQHEYERRGVGIGRNLRTNKTGEFPLFKTDEETPTNEFPTYPNVL